MVPGAGLGRAGGESAVSMDLDLKTTTWRSLAAHADSVAGDLVWLVWWLVGVGYGWGKPLASCGSHDVGGAPSPFYFLGSA